MTEQATAPVAAPAPSEATGPDVKVDIAEVAAETEAEVNESLGQEAPKAEKYKVRVGDDEEEVDIDQLKKSYALDKVLTQRGQEAARLRKEADEEKAQAKAERTRLANLLSGIKDNPAELWKLAESLGINPEEIAIQKAWEKYQWEQLPEHEKAKILAERERDEYKKKFEEMTKKEREEAEAKEAQEIEASIENDIIKVADLLDEPLAGKKGAVTIERIAQAYQSLYNTNKIKPSHEQVATKVRQILDQDLNNLFTKLDPAKAVELLPKELLNGLRDYFIKQAENKKLPFQSSAKVGIANQEATTTKKKVSINEWFNNLGK